MFWLGGAALAGLNLGIDTDHLLLVDSPEYTPLLEEHHGATVCLVRKFSASRFLPDVRYYGATYFGKALRYLMSTSEQLDDHDNPLTHGFGTEASPDDQDEFVRRFGAYLVEGYGSSEGAGSVKLDPAAPPGGLGRPAHEAIAILDSDTRQDCPPAVLDEHGRVLNPDEAIGEMVNKDGAKSFEGYYKNDEANAERIRHGWYWTGDLGYVDEEGFIHASLRAGVRQLAHHRLEQGADERSESGSVALRRPGVPLGWAGAHDVSCGWHE